MIQRRALHQYYTLCHHVPQCAAPWRPSGVLLERVKALQEAEAEHGPGIGVQGDTGDATRLEVSAAVREAEVRAQLCRDE